MSSCLGILRYVGFVSTKIGERKEQCLQWHNPPVLMKFKLESLFFCFISKREWFWFEASENEKKCYTRSGEREKKYKIGFHREICLSLPGNWLAATALVLCEDNKLISNGYNLNLDLSIGIQFFKVTVFHSLLKSKRLIKIWTVNLQHIACPILISLSTNC